VRRTSSEIDILSPVVNGPSWARPLQLHEAIAGFDPNATELEEMVGVLPRLINDIEGKLTNFLAFLERIAGVTAE